MVIIIKVIQKTSGFVIRSHFSTSATSYQQAAIRSSTRMLARSISLRHLNHQSSHISSSIETKEGQNFETSTDRPLVVLLTWLAAQDKHIEKYSNLYLRKGFDVLTVKTSPFDLLFPTIGARKIAQDCVKTLQKELPQYPSVILHAFSVGAYQFGEILLEMQEQQKQAANSLGNGQEKNESKKKLEDRIKGIVFDSVVPIEELSNGVSRSITANQFLYKCIKTGINGHLKVFNNIATKYYKAASHAVWNNYMRVPALILVSQNDRIGTASANQRLTDVWRDLGIDVTWKCWDKSAHVQHLPKHPTEYEELIDRFLNKVKINTNVIAY